MACDVTNEDDLVAQLALARPEMEKAGGGSILAITSMPAENKNKRTARVTL
ncbi:MAG: hypothetical protein ACTHWH_15385 [Marinobacter sp.]